MLEHSPADSLSKSAFPPKEREPPGAARKPDGVGPAAAPPAQSLAGGSGCTPAAASAMSMWAEPASEAPAEAAFSGSAAANAIQGSGTLPHLDVLQKAFGPMHDLNGIRAEVGGSGGQAAAKQGAQGYAAGERVAFAQSPGLRLVAHEVAHVLQQRARGVQDTAHEDPEREEQADAIADRVVRGEAVGKLLPAGPPNQAAPGAVQFKRETQEQPTDQELAAAVQWVQDSHLGAWSIKELQRAVGQPETGVYDESTARAVFDRQRQWQPKGHIAHAGRADSAVLQRMGIIRVKEREPIQVKDHVAASLAEKHPDGVTLSIYADYKAKVSGAQEFADQAQIFAKNHATVGLAGDSIALGSAIPIKDLGDVLGIVQGVHAALLERYKATSPSAGQDQQNREPPRWTQVRALALFAHGERWGLGMNESNDFSRGGLHSEQRGTNPSNVQSFVRGLRGAVTPDVRVALFACSTGASAHPAQSEWSQPKSGEHGGQGSFAETLATELGPDATVAAHTTAGHTTENFAARQFGGGGGGGEHFFDLMYDEEFINQEQRRIFPGPYSPEMIVKMQTVLRNQMWRHFKDGIHSEHNRPAAKKRYKVPLGQEMFIDPDNARAMLHENWTLSWAPEHKAEMRRALKLP